MSILSDAKYWQKTTNDVTMPALLEVQNIKKYFTTNTGILHAVDGISFSINKGETLGVVGESGCGKTTLGKMITHLLSCSSGKMIFNGEDITNLHTKRKKKIRRDIQIIFQDPFSSLNPRKTVYQIISEPININLRLLRSDVKKRVFELMDKVGIDHRFLYSYPHELDGGTRQRIGIARALSLNPKFIVCDEPVSALDVSIQAQILNLLLDLQDEYKLTYMFITHDLAVVKYVSHKIIVLYLGLVVESCQTSDLFNMQLHPYTKALLAAVPRIDGYKSKEKYVLQGELNSSINLKPGCRFALRCPYQKDVCRNSTPSIVEVQNEHYVACHLVKEINQL